MRKILGNEVLKDHFLTAVQQEKVSHAYILEGEKGSGKKTLAQAFATLLQCEDQNQVKETGDFCGRCSSCIMMEHKDHPDVIWVTHEKPNVISVKEVREQIVNTIDIMPYKGPYKIYIIDEAEKMNPAAQNAILKTIEEPPQYAVLLLLTSNRGAFLPTILSRCILLNVKPVSDEAVRKYLEETCGATGEIAEFCTGFAMGNIGKARDASMSENFARMRDAGMNLLRYLHELEDYEIIGRVKELKEWKDTIQDYLDIMLIWYRDILVLKSIKEEKMLIFQSEYSYLKRQCDIVTFEGINQIFQKIYQTRSRIRANVNYDTTMELLHIEIKRILTQEA